MRVSMYKQAYIYTYIRSHIYMDNNIDSYYEFAIPQKTRIGPSVLRACLPEVLELVCTGSMHYDSYQIHIQKASTLSQFPFLYNMITPYLTPFMSICLD